MQKTSHDRWKWGGKMLVQADPNSYCTPFSSFKQWQSQNMWKAYWLFSQCSYLILRNLLNNYYYPLLCQWREWGQRRERTHQRRQGPASGVLGLEGRHHSSTSEPKAWEMESRQVHCWLSPGLHRNHSQHPMVDCSKLIPQSQWVIQTLSSVAVKACSWVAGPTVLLAEQQLVRPQKLLPLVQEKLLPVPLCARASWTSDLLST